jgi:2-dehydropantoate 2-reductase
VQKKTDGPLTVGELDGRRSERVVTLADRLGRAIPTDVTTEITVELWSKLLRNCMLNPVAAVSGLGLHGMGTSRVAPGVCADVGREGAMVAAALGIRIDPPTLYGADPAALVAGDAIAHDAAVAGFVRTYSPQPEVQPSMLQDVLKGRGTEIDFLNGEVAARGRALGVPTPVNDALTALVHAVERGERTPGPGLLEEVAGARIA